MVFGVLLCLLFVGPEGRVVAANNGITPRVFFENPVSFKEFYCEQFSTCDTRTPEHIAMQMSYSVQNDDKREMQLLVNTNALLVNVFETRIYFDPLVHRIDLVHIPETLCEEQFIIENEINQAEGYIKVACGTVLPFQSSDMEHSVIHIHYTVMDKNESPLLMLGADTNFYLHDGLGTQAIVWLQPSQVIPL